MFWGVIGTALASTYFDLLPTEYAFSFWLFLVAWILLIVSMFIYLSSFWIRARWSELLQYWLSIAVLILLIVSAAYHQFTRRDVDSSYAILADGSRVNVPATYQYSGALTDIGSSFNPTSNVTTSTLLWTGTNYTVDDVLSNLTYSRASQYIGLFYTCTHNDTGKYCTVLDEDCATRNDGVVLTGCHQFNTIRAFVVMAILVVGAGVVFRTINFCARSRNLNTLAGVLNLVAFVFALVAVAVGLNWVLYDLSRSSYYIGSSAILLIVAWLFLLRLVLAWNREGNSVKHMPTKDGLFLC